MSEVAVAVCTGVARGARRGADGSTDRRGGRDRSYQRRGLTRDEVVVMNACEVGDLLHLPAVVVHYLAAAAGTRRVGWDGVARVRARGRCSRIA
jgi:hypothetical protein